MDAGAGYLLYHSIGQYAGKSADLARAMAEFADGWGAADDGQWPVALGLRARFIDRWRALIGAPEGTLTTTESVTHGVSMVIGALPDAALRGRTILIAEDAFPSNHFLLSGLAERRGFALRTVARRQGSPWVEDEDMLAAWGPEVALALLTWVSSTSSHRTDVAGLVAHARRAGTMVGVDITQGAGLLPFALAEVPADFVVTTSLKWMCGTPGAGILYLAPDRIADADPALRGWFSQDNPFSWALDAFRLAPDIRRLDSGTPGVMAAVASLPAMDWHAGQDPAAILAQNRRLSHRLIDGVGALGLPLVSPQDDDRRGGSVMVALPDAHPAAEVLAVMRRDGAFADARGQTLRMSPGVMTTEDGIATALAALGRALGRQAA
jgi:kynureninase